MNAAEAGVMVGEWDWALPALEEQLAGELEPEDRVVLLSPLLQIRGWRGEDVHGLVEEVARLTADATDPSSLYSAAFVRALSGFASGADAGTAGAFREAARLSAGNAPTCYVLAARVSLLARDAEAAAADLESFNATGVHGPFVEARRTAIRAGLAALDGRSSDALALYADAFRRYRDLGVEVDAAFTTIEMASLLDPALPEVVAAGAAAREILVRLGARPFLARLDAALSRGAVAPSAAGAAAPARKAPRGSSVKAG